VTPINPCATVVIPTYNRRSFLLKSLNGLNRQTVPAQRYEVIVGVDGSTDDTVDALQDLKPSYQLRWVVQPNRGPAAATNTAAREATGDVLIFLDDDQLASPGLIEAHLETQKRLGNVLVQGLYPLAPGYRRGASLMYERWLIGALNPIDRQHPSTAHIWSANMSLRRSTWAMVGGLDETFREYGGEDTDFGMRVAASGVPVVFEPGALSYHMHEVSYRQVRTQAYSQGRSLVRLARKHAVDIDTFSGAQMTRWVDRLVAAGWRRAPSLMDSLGRSLIGPLWAADVVGIPLAQLTAARLLHRYYKVGGIAIEQLQEAPRHVRSAL
jgi:GT2 family glycosyltransferase